MPSPSGKSLFRKALLLVLFQASALIVNAQGENLTKNAGPFNVATYGALGDSYASGPGAGSGVSFYNPCKRFDKAFGPQINVDTEVEGSAGRNFNFIACSGSKTAQIYQGRSSQAGELAGKNPELVTLSIGGNDAGFFDVLNRCIYRFFSKPTCGGGCGDTGDCTQDCNSAITDLQARIDGDALSTGLDSATAAIFQNAPTTHLYQFLYPKFFYAESNQCNDAQFKVGCSGSISGQGLTSILPLTNARRQALNTLTDNLNAKIIAAVSRAIPPQGGSIEVIDPDPGFNGHRFCEEGVIEPSYNNPNIWFFPFEYTFSAASKFISTFDNTTDCAAILGDTGSGDLGDFFSCGLAKGTNQLNLEIGNGAAPEKIVDGAKVPDDNAALANLDLPYQLVRIFHPTIPGHTTYRDAFVSAYLSPVAADAASG